DLLFISVHDFSWHFFHAHEEVYMGEYLLSFASKEASNEKTVSKCPQVPSHSPAGSSARAPLPGSLRPATSLPPFNRLPPNEFGVGRSGPGQPHRLAFAQPLGSRCQPDWPVVGVRQCARFRGFGTWPRGEHAL